MPLRREPSRLNSCILRTLAFCVSMTVIAFSLTPQVMATALADDPVPPEVRDGIQAALQSRVTALMTEKNADGVPLKRGYYSRLYHKVDDNTYKVSFKIDTALKENMVAERYLYTLTKDSAGWKITKEDLVDTYKGLFRPDYDRIDCFSFDRFTFEKEGLKAGASNGFLCQGYLSDKVYVIGLDAPDLAYQFEPPVPQQSWGHKLLMKEDAPDLNFKPEYAFIRCDAASCESIRGTAFTGLKPVTLDLTTPTLKKVIDDAHKERVKDLKENPFFGFRRPYESDRRTWNIAFHRKGPTEHWFTLDFDNWEPKEVSVFCTTFFQPVYRYHSEETRKSGAKPHDLETRPSIDARDYDLVSLKGRVDLGFGDGETLEGDITYGLKTKRGLNELPFSIARIFSTQEKRETKNPRMTINSLQDGEGNDLMWVRTGLYSGVVVFPKTIAAGTDITLRLQFENKDSIYKVTPSYSYVDRGGWLPFVKFADFIDDFDMKIRVPAKFKTLGIGKKISDVREGNMNVTEWVSESPVSFPTIIFGDYFEAKSRGKSTKTDGTEIPVTIHMDRQSLGDENIAGEITDGGVAGLSINYATWKISTRMAQNYVDIAAQALNLYREVYGIDYPYAKLDLVNDPLGGFYGQAPSSLIYLGNPDFWPKGVISGYLEAGSQISTFQDSVVPHEVAHQWWGSLIANANDENYWFVESLAEYSSALYTESAYGKKKYLEHVDAWRKEILEADARSSVQDGYTVWGGPGGFREYRANLYAKGPYAFHMMRVTWGDELFKKFLKSLASELKGKEIVTRDIQSVAEKTFGANLDWFFDQWLRGVGLPEFTFTYSTRPAEDGQQYIIEGEITQRLFLKPGMAVKEEIAGQYFKGMVPITVIGKSGKEYRKKVLIESPKVAFKFNVPEKPKEVDLNKYGESLGYDIKVVESSSM